MVARKLDRETLLDLYCLYHDPTNDFTIECLANKVGISRTRLGRLFKRVNSQGDDVDYDNDDVFNDALDEYSNEGTSVSRIAQKLKVSRRTVYRKFNKLTND